jgi:hypothetical protein
MRTSRRPEGTTRQRNPSGRGPLSSGCGWRRELRLPPLRALGFPGNLEFLSGTTKGLMAFNRRLVFNAWANSNDNHPFQRTAGAEALAALPVDETVLDHGDDFLTAVEIIAIGTEREPTQLLLHALHGPGSRPSRWGPGEGARSISIGENQYTAFSSHVALWADNIAALDAHANAPGLGRLSRYFFSLARERVVFRPLFEQDAARRLEDLDGIRGVDFAIHDAYKVERARANGMISELMPRKEFPSIQVSAGMSQKNAHDDYIDDAVADELFELADNAEQFFDRIKVRGLSKTLRTKTGQKQSIVVNLLTERLQVTKALDADVDNPSMPGRDGVFRALTAARRELEDDGNKLASAAEARIALDAAE